MKKEFNIFIDKQMESNDRISRKDLTSWLTKNECSGLSVKFGDVVDCSCDIDDLCACGEGISPECLPVKSIEAT